MTGEIANHIADSSDPMGTSNHEEAWTIGRGAYTERPLTETRCAPSSALRCATSRFAVAHGEKLPHAIAHARRARLVRWRRELAGGVRLVLDLRAARGRRHGHRPHRGVARSAQARRTQAPAATRGRQPGPRAIVHSRGAPRRPPQAPEHRPDLRLRQSRRHVLHRDGVVPGPTLSQLIRQCRATVGIVPFPVTLNMPRSRSATRSTTRTTSSTRAARRSASSTATCRRRTSSCRTPGS